MPRKSKNSSSGKSAKERRKSATWGGYVRCELVADEREAFPTWAEENAGKLFSMVDILVRQEVTFSLLLDEENAAYVARLSRVIGDPPATWILTAFHSSPEAALLLVLFKHFIILGEDWSPETGDSGSGFNFG